MRIKMNYGKEGLFLDFPDEWDVTVIKKKQMPILADPAAEVRLALSNPVGSKSLAEEAKGRQSACILICDITRPVPNSIILPVLINELKGAGIRPNCITLLIATGLHRPNEGDELRELIVEDWILKTVEVSNHFAQNRDDHEDIGTTKRGTLVRLDRRFVQADLRIVTGLVEPHFMAGYSGGRKVITPGVADQETITSLHTARFLEDPKAANCVIEGNPLHEEQLEIVSMVGDVLAINAVIDENRRLSYVNFGDIEESHLDAVSYIRDYTEIPISQKFKTVITSSAGYPLDKTYYQTIKGMVGAIDVLAPEGNLFIVSECAEGMGSPEFVEAQKRLIALGINRFLDTLWPKRHADIDEWETEMLIKALRRGTIYLYTEGLSKEDQSLTGVHVVEAIEEAIQKSIDDSGDNRVAVIPEGPYVVPIYSPPQS